MGRPRKHASAAARQKAYRDRQGAKQAGEWKKVMRSAAREATDGLNKEERKEFDRLREAERYRARINARAAGLPSIETRGNVLENFMRMLTFDVAHAAWKRQAALYHPDTGGDASKAAKFNELWTKVKKLYSK